MKQIGFGTWPLGGTAYGPVEPWAARSALETAVERGVRLFDTADIYGDGRVERIVGEVLEGVPDTIIVTKAGYHTEAGDTQDFTADHLRRRLQDSCRRLRRAAVEVFMLHSPPVAMLQDEAVWRALEEVQKAGLARSVGVSLRNVEDFTLLRGRDSCMFVEVILSLLDQRALDLGLVAWAEREGWSVLARLPLCSGFLADRRISSAPELDPSDRRLRWPAEQLCRWTEAADRFRFLERPGRSLQQAALAFLLQLPSVTPIPGMKSAAQVEHDIQSSYPSAHLSVAEVSRVRQEWEAMTNLPPKAPAPGTRAAPPRRPSHDAVKQ